MKKQPKKVPTGDSGQGRKSDDQAWGLSLLDVVFPFLIPVKGMIWMGKKLKETADAEITDKSKVQEELLDLQMRFEMGEVNEEEYKKKEDKLLERLEAIRKYEEENK